MIQKAKVTEKDMEKKLYTFGLSGGAASAADGGVSSELGPAGTTATRPRARTEPDPRAGLVTLVAHLVLVQVVVRLLLPPTACPAKIFSLYFHEGS